eukprot:15457995-Alexandrium_andersonii.AAC.1
MNCCVAGARVGGNRVEHALNRSWHRCPNTAATQRCGVARCFGAASIRAGRPGSVPDDNA